jgi:hypothetical protein
MWEIVKRRDAATPIDVVQEIEACYMKNGTICLIEKPKTELLRWEFGLLAVSA